MAHCRRPAPPEGAEACDAHEGGRGGRARLHALRGRPPRELHSSNLIERLNSEISRRTNIAGTIPNVAAVVRLVGALLPEQFDEWATRRARYLTPAASVPSAILALPGCPPCEPDPAAQPATDHRSYTMRWNTTRSSA